MKVGPESTRRLRMSESEKPFTVSDRRHFTPDGRRKDDDAERDGPHEPAAPEPPSPVIPPLPPPPVSALALPVFSFGIILGAIVP